jgi:hypothetical protein
MPFVASLARTSPRLTPSRWAGVVALCVTASLAGLFTGCSPAPSPATSTDTATPPQSKASGPAAAARPGPQWSELSATHKKALRPLAETWNSLGPSHKNKWIALADNYATRSPEDQAKLQSRMAEWAALTPREREQARMNFAESKKLHHAELAAEWAAYQELSADEKKRLAAAKTADKPAGAAMAITPVPNDKITAVPITRRTAQMPESGTIAKPQIDPNTLLPKVVIPASPDAAPATDVATPGVSADALSPN